MLERVGNLTGSELWFGQAKHLLEISINAWWHGKTNLDKGWPCSCIWFNHRWLPAVTVTSWIVDSFWVVAHSNMGGWNCYVHV